MAKTLQELSDEELEALNSEELFDKLEPEPDLADGLREIWNRTSTIPGDLAGELIADRREQASKAETQVK